MNLPKWSRPLLIQQWQSLRSWIDSRWSKRRGRPKRSRRTKTFTRHDTKCRLQRLLIRSRLRSTWPTSTSRRRSKRRFGTRSGRRQDWIELTTPNSLKPSFHKLVPRRTRRVRSNLSLISTSLWLGSPIWTRLTTISTMTICKPNTRRRTRSNYLRRTVNSSVLRQKSGNWVSSGRSTRSSCRERDIRWGWMPITRNTWRTLLWGVTTVASRGAPNFESNNLMNRLKEHSEPTNGMTEIYP